MSISEIKAAIAAAQAEYFAIANTAPAADVRAASAKVKALKADLAKTLADGADPCPRCGNAPMGLEQPRPGKRGGTEYEVGCTMCSAFNHPDGTIRAPRVRGGLLPRHAVDAWNAGPDHWITVGHWKQDD